MFFVECTFVATAFTGFICPIGKHTQMEPYKASKESNGYVAALTFFSRLYFALCFMEV